VIRAFGAHCHGLTSREQIGATRPSHDGT
jgi:hypothetical protein